MRKRIVTKTYVSSTGFTYYQRKKMAYLIDNGHSLFLINLENPNALLRCLLYYGCEATVQEFENETGESLFLIRKS